MGVPQYTTPTFTLTFTEEDLDLTQANSVYVTFESGMKKLTKSGDDLQIGEKTISVKLAQKETGFFPAGDVSIQANWITAEGDRAASDIVQYNISGQLLKEVIP